jgi:hypothetical protein
LAHAAGLNELGPDVWKCEADVLLPFWIGILTLGLQGFLGIFPEIQRGLDKECCALMDRCARYTGFVGETSSASPRIHEGDDTAEDVTDGNR